MKRNQISETSKAGEQNHEQEQRRSPTWTTDISKAPLLDNIFAETGSEIAIFNCVLKKGW